METHHIIKMNREKMRLEALKLVNKKVPAKRKKRTATKPKGARSGRSFYKQKEILADIRAGHNMYVSTLDVEMTKWRFFDQTGVKVELIKVSNDDENVYQYKLV